VKIAGGAAIVLVLALGAAVALSVREQPVALPSPSPSATPTATASPTPSPSPSPSPTPLIAKVYTLTPTAAAVVQEITAGCAPEDIAPRLLERFDGPPAAIENEVKAFIAELRDKGLVEG